jgi:hypothetical protein
MLESEITDEDAGRRAILGGGQVGSGLVPRAGAKIRKAINRAAATGLARTLPVLVTSAMVLPLG